MYRSFDPTILLKLFPRDGDKHLFAKIFITIANHKKPEIKNIKLIAIMQWNNIQSSIMMF